MLNMLGLLSIFSVFIHSLHMLLVYFAFNGGARVFDARGKRLCRRPQGRF